MNHSKVKYNSVYRLEDSWYWGMSLMDPHQRIPYRFTEDDGNGVSILSFYADHNEGMNSSPIYSIRQTKEQKRLGTVTKVDRKGRWKEIYVPIPAIHKAMGYWANYFEKYPETQKRQQV